MSDFFQDAARLMNITADEMEAIAFRLCDAFTQCEHIATVTTPTWPVVHRSPVSIGDDVHVLPPVLVTECVTCNTIVATEGA